MISRDSITLCVAALVSVLGCTGCDRARAAEPASSSQPSSVAMTMPNDSWRSGKYTMWYTSHDTADPAEWIHHNYYEWFGQYRDYAIATYDCGDPSDRGVSDVELVRRSLRLIHQAFRQAYLDGTLGRYRYDGSPEPVRFTPAYICVVVHDFNVNKYYCGVVVPADQLFRAAHADDLHIDETMLEHGNIFQMVYPPGQPEVDNAREAHRYFIIERHMARRAGK